MKLWVIEHFYLFLDTIFCYHKQSLQILLTELFAHVKCFGFSNLIRAYELLNEMKRKL